jgi:hypothetical protein
MSSEEIWNDPDYPRQKYLATLADVNNGFNLGDPFDFEAATEREAWGLAYQWAMDGAATRKRRLASCLQVATSTAPAAT